MKFKYSAVFMPLNSVHLTLVHDTQASFSTYAEGIYGDGTTPALF
jgi:hypothetical protein